MAEELIFRENGKIERRFEIQGPNKNYLERLRRKEKLGSVVAKCRNDYEAAGELCSWVSRRISHGERGEAGKQDPISILEEADAGKRLRCVEFAVLLRGCLDAVGIRARVLALKVKNARTAYAAGHVVVEAFLKAYNKWALFDPQYGVHATLNGIPLNAVELHNAINSNRRELKIIGRNKADYIKFVYRYLFYFDTRLNSRKILMLVPIGYRMPRYFEGVLLPKVYLPTHSLATFYQRPWRGRAEKTESARSAVRGEHESDLRGIAYCGIHTAFPKQIVIKD